MDQETLAAMLAENETRVRALLAAHEQRITEGFAKMGAALADAIRDSGEAMRDSARIAEEGPRERWRQNLAASVQLLLIKERSRQTEDYAMSHDNMVSIAAQAVMHADAMLAAIETKEP